MSEKEFYLFIFYFQVVIAVPMNTGWCGGLLSGVLNDASFVFSVDSSAHQLFIVDFWC